MNEQIHRKVSLYPEGMLRIEPKRTPAYLARPRRRTPLLLLLLALGCASARRDVPPPSFKVSAEQQLFLDKLQKDTFAFFWDTTPQGNGLTPDRYPGDGVSSVAAIGFALTSYPVGAERGWITRTQAADRTLSTLKFLSQVRQGPEASGVSGYNGFFYHFLDARTGCRAGNSELSTIDTALLMAGVLLSQAYFDRADVAEAAIRTLADDLYRRVDWSWAYSRRNAPLLSMGWSPENGYIEADWGGYNEGMILYALALGSPTHPIDPRAWDEWTSTYHWEDLYGFPHLSFGPLFGHQYSHVWIDFRGIQDRYMKAKGIDYFENSTRATYANRAYCMANPAKWTGYGATSWGLTASDGPSAATTMSDAAVSPFHSYWARGAGRPHSSNDDGTLAPTAAGGSVPFAPELAIPTLWGFHSQFGDRLYGKYGFKDAFNLSFGAKSPVAGWFDDQYVAIDQGPILLMIENFRAGFVWELMKKNQYLRAGLGRAGFTGGWLARSASR